MPTLGSPHRFLRRGSVLLLLVLLTALLDGCSSIWPKSPARWDRDLLDGLALKRASERWNFSRDGKVTFYPNVDVIPGAELLSWRVEGDWLVVTDREGRPYREYRLENVGPLFITVVTHEGTKVRFTYDKT